MAEMIGSVTRQIVTKVVNYPATHASSRFRPTIMHPEERSEALPCQPRASIPARRRTIGGCRTSDRLCAEQPSAGAEDTSWRVRTVRTVIQERGNHLQVDPRVRTPHHHQT